MTAQAAIATVTTLASSASEGETVWDVDPGHSTAGFKVRHLMVSNVKGELGPIKGSVWLDEAQPARSRVEVTIDATHIDTRNPDRDKHLRGADFLDVDKFPTLAFKSTRVRKGRDGGLEVTGELTIRGVTKPIVLSVEALPRAVNDPWGNVKRGAAARARFNRKDFGLVWNAALETGGVVVGDEVSVEIELELVQRKAGKS